MHGAAPSPTLKPGSSSIQVSFSCFGAVAAIRRYIYRPKVITGKVGRPPNMWETKGQVVYRIEAKGELGAIIYGNLRNLSFRSREEAIAVIKLSPYIYEQNGLKQLAVAGMKIGRLESEEGPRGRHAWLFRADEGPNQKIFECLEVLCFSTIERVMEMVMTIYERDLKASLQRPGEVV